MDDEEDVNACGAVEKAAQAEDEKMEGDADDNKPTKEAAGADSAMKNAKILDELHEWIDTEFFLDLRGRVLQYLDEMQIQQQQNISSETYVETHQEDGEPESDDEHDVSRASKAERLRQHSRQKWSFPAVAGRRKQPGSVEFEFMRTLIQVFRTEHRLADKVEALRERMCQKLRISSFASGVDYSNPCFPLVLRDVVCPWCCVALHVDVTSHKTKGPGMWVCQNCDRLYDKDAMQARLVELVESEVQAWQSQDIVCTKCRSLRTSQLQNFCECFGRWEVRFKATDFRLVLQVLHSLVATHDLQWLGEMLKMYQKLL